MKKLLRPGRDAGHLHRDIKQHSVLQDNATGLGITRIIASTVPGKRFDLLSVSSGDITVQVHTGGGWLMAG